MSTLSKGMLLSTGISAPSTSREKWWTVGLPSARRAEYSGKHWVVVRVRTSFVVPTVPLLPPPIFDMLATEAVRGTALALFRSLGSTFPESGDGKIPIN